MPVALIAAIITAGTPLVTALFKKLFKTDALPEGKQKMVHQLVPLGFGLAASVLTCAAGLCQGDACPAQASWLQCALYGLAYGAGGSYLRDFDTNVTKFSVAATALISKMNGKPNDQGQ